MEITIKFPKETITNVAKGMLAFHFALVFAVLQSKAETTTVIYDIFMVTSAFCIAVNIAFFVFQHATRDDNSTPSATLFILGMITSVICISTFFGLFIGKLTWLVPIFVFVAFHLASLSR